MHGPPWTVKALLAATAEFFQKKGLDSPRLDAQILLAHVLKCSKIDLMVRYGEEPTDGQRAAFRELVRQRSEHWPTAYLTGHREFYMLAMEVSPAVLIPRPDTETLVLAVLGELKAKPSATILDLGTGSGCIAVSLAKHAPGARVTAVDVSPDALIVAKRNAATHAVEGRVSFLQGDLFAPVSGRFDVIASNPPYIAPGEFASLSPEVRDHEPRIALDGGPDGLNFYRRIAAGAGAFLAPGGVVFVEIGSTQDESVRAIFAAAGYAVSPTIRDAGKRPRVIQAHLTEADA